MDEPCFENWWWDEIDFVENEYETFPTTRGGHDHSFNLFGSGSFRIASIENVKNDIRLVNNLLENLVKGLSRSVLWCRYNRNPYAALVIVLRFRIVIFVHFIATD